MKSKAKFSKLFFSIIFLIIVLSIPISQKSLAFQDQPIIGGITVNGVDYPSWNWTMTEVISSGGLNRGYDPSIAVDSIGNIYIVWEYYMGGINGSLYLSIWNVTTQSWNTPELVSTESPNYVSFPSLCVDSYDNLHLSWTDSADILGSGSDNDIFYKFRSSTNSSWTTTEVVSTESINGTSESTTAVDSNGNVHIVWTEYTDFAGNDYDVNYKFKNATSGVWNTTELISVGSSYFSAAPDIGVDLAGNVHIIWRDDESNYIGSGTDTDVFYRLWNVTSTNWHEIELASSESTHFCTNPSLDIDLGGNAHIVWQDGTNYDGSGFDYDVIYKMKNATSLSWTTPEVVSTESDNTIAQPEITIDSRNNIHVSWLEPYNYTGEGSDMDLYYKFKNATSLSWNLTEVVSTESTDHSQDICLSADMFGTIHFAWIDMTDYLGAGTDFDIHYKRLAINYLPPTVLDTIIPNPSTTGNVTLNWEAVEYASKYYVYRSTSTISSIDGLTPITVSSVTTYEDLSLANDIYYYVIVAATPFVKSAISNQVTVDVNVIIIPEFSLKVQLSIGLMIGASLLVIHIRRKKKH